MFLLTIFMFRSVVDLDLQSTLEDGSRFREFNLFREQLSNNTRPSVDSVQVAKFGASWIRNTAFRGQSTHDEKYVGQELKTNFVLPPTVLKFLHRRVWERLDADAVSSMCLFDALRTKQQRAAAEWDRERHLVRQCSTHRSGCGG